MKNGYAPSIVQSDSCFICGRTEGLQRHEVFHGANRDKSKRLGCWVTLCYQCHHQVHNGHDGLDHRLKVFMQRKAMQAYRWDRAEFIRVFGKNYLEEEE